MAVTKHQLQTYTIKRLAEEQLSRKEIVATKKAVGNLRRDMTDMDQEIVTERYSPSICYAALECPDTSPELFTPELTRNGTYNISGEAVDYFCQ